MNNQYRVPLYICQWCYKTTGRFILDCMCLACEQCYVNKKSWVDEQGRCYCCQKQTARKFIDLKTNPQQGGMYFQNLNIAMNNAMKIQQFQQQMTRKYCKHLEKKANKLQAIITTFISKFPQYQNFFESAFKHYEQKQNPFRSKSAQIEAAQNQGVKMMYPSNTQRNIQMKQPVPKVNPDNSKYIPNNIPRNQNSRQNYQPRQHQYSVASKRSQVSMVDSQFGNVSYPNQMKMVNQPRKPNMDSMSKNIVRNNAQKMVMNPNRVYQNNVVSISPRQLYQSNQPSQQSMLYIVDGNKKFSDPAKHQMNLNNINMQTALRSIRSEDERVYPEFQNNLHNPNVQNEQINHFINPQDTENRRSKPPFQGFARKKVSK